jgi:acetyltransferase-like isoleucine patch superfamily enzyme|tara:strand:+ start:2439 stop:2900 length:462 start_codon:yes stop_codon:yes gene_type:complete
LNNLKKTKSTITKVIFGKNCMIIEPVNIYDCKIGNSVFVGPFVEIQKNSIIGDNTKVQSHSFICEKVTIGKECFISHGVMFINDLTKSGKIAKNTKLFKKTTIGNRVIIGSNATILPVIISNDIVVGAGSVVTKNLRIKGVYAGNPARLIRRL